MPTKKNRSGKTKKTKKSSPPVTRAPDFDDPAEEAAPPVYSAPEDFIKLKISELEADDVVDKWYYRDRDEAAQLIRCRLEGVDCDVTLQMVQVDGGYWAQGWPPKENEKVPLYRAYEGLDKSPVFVCHDESAVESAIAMGLSAVTSAGGAEDVARSNWRPLAGREVVILPTNSREGRHKARAVAKAVIPLDPPPAVRMLELPGLEEGEDVGNFAWDLKISQQERGERIVKLAALAPRMRAADVEVVPVVERLADVVPTPVRWLWPGRVPIGRPTLILAGLDHGKSMIAANLAACVSTGRDWPDGRGRAPKGR